MPGNKKWIKINEWRRQQAKIKMNIEFVRFAYAWVCRRPYTCVEVEVYGARVFCMPYEMIKVKGFVNIVLLEWLPCFSLAWNPSANARNERFVLQAIGGFFMFRFFSSFSILCAHKTHFARYGKVGNQRETQQKCLGFFDLWMCFMLYLSMYFSDCR